MSEIKNPKILYVIGQLRRGGAEQQFYYLLKYAKPNATVISMEKNDAESYWRKPICDLGYQVIEIERSHRADYRRFTRISETIRAEKPDIVHLFTDTPSGIYGRLACTFSRQLCVVGERRHPSFDPGWYAALKRYWLNHNIAASVANARSSVEYLVQYQGVPARKAHYIPNGIELARFSHRDTPSKRVLPDGWQNKPIVITVASLLPKKAPDLFVRTAAAVLAQRADVGFIYVGKGPLLESALNQARDLGIADKLWFTGERLDVPDMLKASDVFLLTSASEGMPNVIMEAMASALPCVATDIGDVRALIEDDETGFVAPFGDVNKLSESILSLLNSPTRRQEMGERGYQKIQAYDVTKMAEQYQELYQQALSLR